MLRRLAFRALLVGAACCAASGAARADAPPVRAVRDAIEVREARCIQRDVLAAEVAGWIKADSIDARLSVVVDGDARSEVSFELARDGAPVGRRTFRTAGVTCPNVMALLSLAIAMAIDATPLAALESTPPAPAPSPTGGRDAAPVATGPANVQAPPARSSSAQGRPPSISAVPRSARVIASLELSALLGVLPRPAIAGAIAVSFALGTHLWLRAASFESTSVDAPLGGGRFDSSIAAGEIEACLSAGSPSLVWRACVGAAFGRLVATGGGFDVPATATLPWTALASRLEALVHLSGPLDLLVFAGQALPLPSPPKLDVKRADGATTLAATTLPAAGFSVGVGPAFQFP